MSLHPFVSWCKRSGCAHVFNELSDWMVLELKYHLSVADHVGLWCCTWTGCWKQCPSGRLLVTCRGILVNNTKRSNKYGIRCSVPLLLVVLVQQMDNTLNVVKLLGSEKQFVALSGKRFRQERATQQESSQTEVRRINFQILNPMSPVLSKYNTNFETTSLTEIVHWGHEQWSNHYLLHCVRNANLNRVDVLIISV